MLKWLGLGGLAAAAGLGATKARAGNPYYNGPVSDHFDGTTFFNPGGEEPRGFTDLLRWQFGERRAHGRRSFPAPSRETCPRKRCRKARCA